MAKGYFSKGGGRRTFAMRNMASQKLPASMPEAHRLYGDFGATSMKLADGTTCEVQYMFTRLFRINEEILEAIIAQQWSGQGKGYLPERIGESDFRVRYYTYKQLPKRFYT